MSILKRFRFRVGGKDAVDEYIHIVEVQRTKTKTKIIYEYCDGHNND